MTLLVHEIYTSVYQSVRPTKNINIGAIRPHLYIHNVPTGNLKVQICESDGTLLVESPTTNISTISAGNEYHGYVTFYVDAMLLKNTDYLIYVVSGGGYSFNNSAYVGVCNDYDLRKYQPNYTVNHPRFAPLDLEIWSLSQK